METEREGRYRARTQSPCALIRLSAGLTKSVRMHINPTLSRSDMTLMQPKKYTTKKRQHANNALSHIPACTSSNIIWPPPAIPLPAHSLCVSSSLACGRHPRCSSVRRRAGRERQRAAQETHTTSSVMHTLSTIREIDYFVDRKTISPSSRHQTANWVSFDLNVSCSSC